MKSAVETLTPTRVKLTVEVPFDELAPSLDAAYKAIAQQVSIPGFRKGKVPTRIIDQRVGRGAVLEEAINKALPKAYDDAVREAGIAPVSRPDIEITEIDDGNRLAFTAEVDIRPEFDLPDYSGIRVEVADAEPTDADVEEQLEALRGRFATLTPVERPAADGDILLVDISGVDDTGAAVEDLSGAAMSYELGTDGMIPGFDEAVRGAAAGETRTVEFTPTAGEYADRPLTATVTVSAVRERVLPELDDSFAMLASEFDTVAELRADIGERLTRVKRLEQVMEARGKVHDALLALVDFPVPEGAVEEQVAEHFEDGHGDDDHRAEVAEETRTAMRSQFLLDRIAQAEEVAVGESELSSWLVQQAPRYGMGPDALAQALIESGQLPMAIQDIRRGKALAVVTRKAEIVDASGRTVDLEEIDEQMRAAGAEA